MSLEQCLHCKRLCALISLNVYKKKVAFIAERSVEKSRTLSRIQSEKKNENESIHLL